MDPKGNGSGNGPRARALLLITHLDPGGAQETVLMLAAGLPRHGFDVVVASAPGGAHETELRETGVPFLPLPGLARQVHLGRDIRAFAAVDRLVRSGFDIVHTHSSKAGILGRLAARRLRVPGIVHTSHGLPVNPDMRTVERTVLLTAERLASKACHRVVAVSDATARELRTLRLARPDQIVVIPSGVPIPNGSLPERAAARRALGLDGEGPVVGWVGRHFEQKRPELIVRAARRILERAPNASVVMVGDGPLLARTRREAADEPRIRVLGYHHDIGTVYAALDVFLLASAWEGLPRTVLEAQAAGVPVVSTRVSGIPEVVHDGVSGFLVSPGDWRGLADRALHVLLGDAALRRSMSDAARRAVTDAYSAERTVSATAGLYNDLLSRSRPARG